MVKKGLTTKKDSFHRHPYFYIGSVIVVITFLAVIISVKPYESAVAGEAFKPMIVKDNNIIPTKTTADIGIDKQMVVAEESLLKDSVKPIVTKKFDCPVSFKPGWTAPDEFEMSGLNLAGVLCEEDGMHCVYSLGEHDLSEIFTELPSGRVVADILAGSVSIAPSTPGQVLSNCQIDWFGCTCGVSST